MLKFAIVFAGLTVPLAFAWAMIFPGRIYQCTDDVPFDYFSPTQRVHEPVFVVDHIKPVSSMSEPDSILRGWSVGGLHLIWLSTVGFSLGMGAWAARHPWRSSRNLPVE